MGKSPLLWCFPSRTVIGDGLRYPVAADLGKPLGRSRKRRWWWSGNRGHDKAKQSDVDGSSGSGSESGSESGSWTEDEGESPV